MNGHYEHIHLLTQPQQNKTQFETILGRPIVVGKQEQLYACLTEISCADAVQSSWISKDQGGNLPRIGICVPFIAETFYHVEIAEGYYSSRSIARVLNRRMKEVLGNDFTSDLCSFLYNNDTDRIEIRINGTDPNPKRRVTVMIFNSIGRQLGFMKNEGGGYFVFGAKNDQWLPNINPRHATHAVADFPCPLQSDFSFFFIYLDILTVQ